MPLEIGFAQTEDLPRLHELWRDCFAADDAYRRLFFAGRFRREDCLVARLGGTAVGMLYRLPLTFWRGEARLPARYVYAVATHPQHRGGGVSSALLEEHHQLCEQEGCALSLLVPAGESLFDFYRKRGFSTTFTRHLQTAAAQPAEIPFSPGSLADCKGLRDGWFGGSALYGCWDRAALDYAQRECEIQGGELLTFPGGYLLARPQGEDALQLLELVPGSYTPEQVAAAAAAYFKKAQAAYPAWPAPGGPYAMAAFYTELPPLGAQAPAPYFALPLD